MTTTQRLTDDTFNTVTAAIVFLFALAVYTFTMTQTVPFWDSGEYIATSYIVGVPHPPGTPLYVLIGRMFTLIPIGSIAQRVNWFSALASAITILFTYLITVKAARRLFPIDEEKSNRAISYGAGVVAAFMAAFATTFWDNAIEAEVYAAACAIMTFCVWVVLRWQERLDEGTEDGLLLLITYIVGLGVGIHLGVAIAAWAAVAFVFICRPHYLKQWNYLGWAIVTLSLGVGINQMTFLWAPIVLVVTLVMWLFTGRLQKLPLWSSLLFMAGVSVHFYLLIRAGLDPAINEGNPSDWKSLWLLLIRDQYKPGSPLERRAPIPYQIDHMWLRYMYWNFTLFVAKGKAFFHLPILLAIVGAVVHLRRDRKTWVILGTLFLFLGPAMVFYLNFREGEVRERDYFFVQNFQFMAIWVGLGAAWVVEGLRRQFSSPVSRRAAAVLGSAAFVGMSLLPLNHNWFSHNRRNYTLAHNYAHNLLAGLEPNSILFTNGDNDTFPLWYIQEVEEFRRDVRVVNLSLLNTTWYIRQLRDLEPKMPITWTDGQVETIYEALPWVHAQASRRTFPTSNLMQESWGQEDLQQVLDVLIEIQREGGRREYSVREVAVDHIIRNNQGKLPVYIAVSVPDQLGVGDRMSMEGLAFRVYETPVTERTNVAKLRHNLFNVFKYSGFVKPGDSDHPESIGVYDDTLYKGTGPSEMSENNHAAAFSRYAIELFRAEKDTVGALRQLDNAAAIAPRFVGVAITKGYILEGAADWAGAAEHYRASLAENPRNWQLNSRLGATLIQLGRVQESVPFYEFAIAVAPQEYEPYQGLATAYYNLNLPDRAMDALRRYLARVPGDTRAQTMLQSIERSAAGVPDTSR